MTRLIVALSRLRRELKTQRVFNDAFLKPYLKALEEKFAGSFANEQTKKIYGYYALFIPSVLCAGYKNLYGVPFTEEERRRAALFGVLTPVGDDLFDVEGLRPEDVRLITYTPEAYKPTTFSAAVAKEIQTDLLQNVPYKDGYRHAATAVYSIQLETKKQTDPSISDEELERITYAKGGYSVIVYHWILNEAPTPQMLQTLFEIGGLMQLTNDIFDMHKDLRDGIVTLPNRCTNFSALKEKFMAKTREMNRRIYALPYAERNKEEFSVVMHFIVTRGLVMLDQMIRLEKRTGGPLDCKSLTRQQLICDMEKPANVLRWLAYIYQFSKRAK